MTPVVSVKRERLIVFQVNISSPINAITNNGTVVSVRKRMKSGDEVSCRIRRTIVPHESLVTKLQQVSKMQAHKQAEMKRGDNRIVAESASK